MRAVIQPTSLISGILLLLFNSLISMPIKAHEARPLLVEVVEHSASQFSLTVQYPQGLAVNNYPELTIPNCQHGTYLYNCQQAINEQKEIQLKVFYPLYNPGFTTALRIKYINEQPMLTVSSPEIESISFPRIMTSQDVFSENFYTGVHHIWQGWDHLLFLLCLLFIIRDLKKLIWAITGFTLSHSISLILVFLLSLSLSIKVTELLITLSIAFMAAEALRQNHRSLTFRYPIVVTTAIGLIHGLGFANFFQSFNLGNNVNVLALFSFNLGVEFGQIVFFIGALTSIKLLRLHVWKEVNLNIARSASLYLIGSISCYWFIDRL